MSSINTRSPNVAPSPTSNPAGQPASGVASTTRAPSATSAQPAMTTPDVASAGAAAIKPPKAKINGLKNLTTTFDSFDLARTSTMTVFTPSDTATGRVERGYVKCEAEAIADGFRLHVKTFHEDKNDKVTLVLQTEVFDPDSNSIQTINLSVLANAVELNGNSYRGNYTVDVSYDDINKFFKKRKSKLQVTPGTTQLFVAAFWNDGSGGVSHRAGGPGRGGDFRTPAPNGTMSATGAWIQGLSGTAAKPTQDLPLDMAVSYPTRLTADYPVLKADGNVVTRLESEFKGVADKDSMTKAISRMYEMASQAASGDKSEIQKLLGKNWTVSTVNRYWLKDDGSANLPGKAGAGFFKGFRVDDDNLPIQDPMLDHYMDDKDLSLTRTEGALRLRNNKAATVINIKPGGGVIDPKTGIRQRVEVGLELIPEATLDEARDVLDGLNENGRWSGTIFNHAAHEIGKLDGNIDLAEALVPWLELRQDRHKFTIKNEKTGVEVEISLDKVMAKTVRDAHANINGEARETTFYVMESELDHLQLSSSNQASYVSDNASAGIFDTDDSQDDWLENISDNATMDVDPRLHELEDLDNKAFRNTSSYKSFEVANAIMTQELFPAGFAPAKQKAAQAAELLGLEPITADVAVSMVARTVVQSGLDWSPTLDNALRQLATTPARVEKILSELKLHEDNQDVGRLLQRLLGIATPPLKYDQDALFERVRKTLEPLGWGVGSDVKAFLAKLDASKVTPAFLFDELESAYYRSGSQIFGYIAAHQGIAPVILKFDVTSLRPSFDDACKNADIAKTDRQGIWDFIEKANAGGADQSQIQNAIQYLGNERTDYLIDLENAAGVPLPEIHVTGKQIYNKFLIHTSSFHLIPDTSLEKFWTDVAAKVELVDLETLIEDITYYGFTQSMQAAADAASIKAPKLNYDFAAIDASYKSSFDYGMIKYDAKTRDFLHKLLERGASPDSMESAVSDIDSMTLKEALERYDVDIPGRLTIPPTKWNVAKIVSELQNKYSYDWTKSVGKYVRETLKVAGKSHSFNYYDIYSRDLTDLLETLEYESGISIPDKVLKSLS